MRELISHLGLRFYLFEIRGSLTYTHTRNGKAPKVYEICESDIEDESESDTGSTEDTTKLDSNIDASAVGIQLRLIKNDGVLKIEFEGRKGAAAEWTFHGMGLLGGGKMVAAAATQTDVDEKKCLVCKEEKSHVVEMKHEETPTEMTVMQSMETQTMAVATSSIGVQVTPPLIPLHRQVPKSVDILGPFIDAPAARKFGPLAHIEKIPANFASVGSQTESSIEVEALAQSENQHFSRDVSALPHLKRKASTTYDIMEPLNKRTKCTHDSQQWPRHLYLDCYRNMPIFKGDVGTLHIDVQEGTAFFEGWYGRQGMRVQERKQIDLRDKSTRVSYEPLKNGMYGHTCGIDNATHDLCIDRLNNKNETITLFHADCSAPGWKMFGLNTAYFSFDKPLAKDMIHVGGPKVIVDALVYCIDVASHREAVHDPDTEHKLLKEVEEYKVRQKTGGLDDDDNTNWEWTVRELKRREEIRKRLRVIDGDKEMVPTGAEEFREFLSGVL